MFRQRCHPSAGGRAATSAERNRRTSDSNASVCNAARASVVRWTFSLGLVFMTAGCAHTGARVEIEVFCVGFASDDGPARYLHRLAPLGLDNPDGPARSLAEESGAQVVMLHSTSWRWEEGGRIVLTYLAWAREGTLPPAAEALPETPARASTDPLRPRPKEIARLDPLFHGLRHFAFLLRNDESGAVRFALGERAAALLAPFAPEPAGQR